MRTLMSLFAALLIAASPAFAGQERDNAALQKKVNALSKDVEDALGVEFKKEISAAYQSREDFAKFVREGIEKEMPKEKRDALTQAYVLLNLVPEGFDLMESITDLMKTQAGAYYDPETKKMYVLMSQLTDEMMDGMLFHELVHAMQDQEHDLTKKMKELSEAGNDDAAGAYRFLVEGEASFWMLVSMVEVQTGQDWETLPDLAKNLMLAASKNTTTKKLLKQMDLQAKMMGDEMPDLVKAAEGIKKVPPIFVRSLMDPYTRGLYASSRIYDENDGAEAFRKMFKESLPTCTRDMMFPDDWIKEPRGVATVKIASFKDVLDHDWKKGYEDTLGALTLHTMFENHRRTADRIAKGWNGDRFQTWQNGDEAFIIVVATFETEKAAETLAKQLEYQYREEWTKGTEIKEHAEGFVHLSADSDHFLVQVKDTQVAFVRGSLPVKATAVMETLWKSEVKETEPVKHP